MLLLAFCGSGTAQLSPWIGDFETGDLQQWDGVQEWAPGRVSIERTNVRSGRYAARFEVRPGDRWAGLAGERAEVLKGVGEVAGVESYWSWSTFFPASFTSDPTAGFQMFTQWHPPGGTNLSGVSFQVSGERLVVRVAGGLIPEKWQQSDLGPLVRGVWQDFIVHIRWGSDGSGFLEVWRNGALAMPATYAPNIGIGLGTYIKQGFYRLPSSLTTVILHDGLRFGTRLDDVAAPFDLRFNSRPIRAKKRIWFSLRSFTHTPVRVSVRGADSRKVSLLVRTNGAGTAWGSLPCARACMLRGERPTLVATAAVAPALPRAVRVAAASVR